MPHIALVDVSRYHATPRFSLHILDTLAQEQKWSVSYHGLHDPPPPKTDVVAITLCNIIHAPNIPHYLTKTVGIPSRATDRTNQHPLIIAGGQACAAPAPFAPFLDLIYLGEAEPGFGRLLRLIQARPKEQALDRLAELPYCYLPDRKPSGNWIRAARTWPHAIHLNGAQVFEAARGCPYRCTFCQPSRLMAPWRWTPADEILPHIQAGKCNLWTPSLPTHPHAPQLLQGLAGKHARITVAQGCWKDLTPDLITTWTEIGLIRLSIGVEGCTPKIRKSVGKPASDQHLADLLLDLCAHIPFLRLYMIPGLPGHTRRHTDQFAAWLRTWLPHRPRPWKGNPSKIIIAPTSFVPMPHTPLQGASWFGDGLLEHWRDTLTSLDAPGCDFYWHQWTKLTPMARIAFALPRTGTQFAQLLEAIAPVRTTENGTSWNGWEVHKFYKYLDSLQLTLPLHPRQLPDPTPWSSISL